MLWLCSVKSSEVVRVVSVKDKSVELCGGTHIDNTAKIGLFKIISESSVAAGVRRIEAVTGYGVLKLADDYKHLAYETAEILKCSAGDIAKRALQIGNELRETKKQLEKTEAKLAAGKINEIISTARDVGGIRVLSARLDGTPADELKKTAESIKADYPDVIAVLAGINGDKLTFCAACGKEAVDKGAHAGNLVKEVAKAAGGNGGGKPDVAMAGGKDITKVDAALQTVGTVAAAQMGVK